MKKEIVARLGALGALACVAGAGYLFLQHSGRDRLAQAAISGPAAIPVTTAVADQKDVPLYVRGIGTVQAFNTAVIKTRVDGEIVKVAFQEGQDVKAGDPLFQIDPRPFQAALDEATATQTRNQAQLVGAELDLNRYIQMANQGFQSIQLRDQQQSKVDALKGSIAADEAAMHTARLNLAYANIRAPFDGRTGTRLVDIGNLVQASQATSLVSINQIKPIYVNFTVPQDVNDDVRRNQAQGALTVVAYGSNDTELARGTLSVIDNQIDTTTGTLRLKATFGNDDEHLWPGQFVNVRLVLSMRSGTVTVPQRAAMQAASGYFCFVVKADGTAERRAIEIAGVQDGIAVITSGVTAGENVVIDGQFRLTDGARVQGPDGAGAAGGRHDVGAQGLSPRHEHLRTVHPPAHRDVAGDDGAAGLRRGRLHAAAGRGPARRRLSDDHGLGVPARRQPGHHGHLGGDAARAAVRRHPRPGGDDVVERARQHLDHAAVRPRPQHRRRRDRRADRDQRRRRPAAQGPADAADLPQGQRRRPAGADLRRPFRRLPLYKIDDYAYTVLAQKISAISGVAQVTIGGQQDFAVRIRADPAALASHGISMEDIRKAIAAATRQPGQGHDRGQVAQSLILDTNDQLFEASGYRDVIVAFRNGAPVRIRDIAEVIDGARLPRTGAWYNDKKAEVLLIFRQPGANITQIVDQVRATMPPLLASLPPSLHVDLMSDRSLAVEASIADVKFTLVLTIGLVVLVILVFLRTFWATVIPSVAVPLALVATFVVMYALGYSVNNLTLMALTIAVGFVVDDAIVMIENIVRYIEEGDTPFEAALKGAGEIGFTIVSITISLIAVFIPLLLMGGMVGVLFREFAVTVTAAVVMSAFVSLTLTPVMCARFLHHRTEHQRGRLDRMLEDAFDAVQRRYDRGLHWVLDHQPITLAATVALAVLTGWLYVTIPKGLFPQQDTGFVFVTVEGRQDISFAAMVDRQNEVSSALLQDPAVESVVAFAGTGPIIPSENLARLFVQLKPHAKRDVSADQFVRRIRAPVDRIQDVNVYLQASQDLNFGGRLSRTQYQYTLTSIDTAELNRWAPILDERMRGLSKLQDNASDQQIAARHLDIDVDRDTASRLGISLATIDQTLYDTFGERQVAMIYSPITQYRVLLESAGYLERGPAALARLYVPGANDVQVPLSTVARFVDKVAPLTINHQGQFPSVTLSFNLAPGAALSEAVEQIHRLRKELKVPSTVDGAFQGIAQVFEDSLKSTPVLILAAIVAVYIVLGMLYESYIHPITILSALPSAGVGALLALMAFGYDLSVIALIGIILLIGIVKKNAIMMIDFALKAEREQGMSPREAIHEACLLRFRPIMMTTFAAIGGGVPLALGQGAGSELRHPLGVAIVGGLLVSQWLTLYTTPVVYLYLDRLSRWLTRRGSHRKVAAE